MKGAAPLLRAWRLRGRAAPRLGRRVACWRTAGSRAVALVGLGLLLGCAPARQGAPTAAPAAPRPTAQPTASKAPNPGGAAATAQQVAAAGQAVYQQQCQACHGDSGQGVVGPALIGPRASPAKYGPTAADWSGYIRTNMPQNAPGSLTQQQYLEVTAYLLLQNGLVQPSQPLDEQALQQIKTER